MLGYIGFILGSWKNGSYYLGFWGLFNVESNGKEVGNEMNARLYPVYRVLGSGFRARVYTRITWGYWKRTLKLL